MSSDGSFDDMDMEESDNVDDIDDIDYEEVNPANVDGIDAIDGGSTNDNGIPVDRLEEGIVKPKRGRRRKIRKSPENTQPKRKRRRRRKRDPHGINIKTMVKPNPVIDNAYIDARNSDLIINLEEFIMNGGTVKPVSDTDIHEACKNLAGMASRALKDQYRPLGIPWSEKWKDVDNPHEMGDAMGTLDWFIAKSMEASRNGHRCAHKRRYDGVRAFFVSAASAGCVVLRIENVSSAPKPQGKENSVRKCIVTGSRECVALCARVYGPGKRKITLPDPIVLDHRLATAMIHIYAREYAPRAFRTHMASIDHVYPGIHENAYPLHVEIFRAWSMLDNL